MAAPRRRQAGSPGVARGFQTLQNTQEFRLNRVGVGVTDAAPTEAFTARGAFDRIFTLTLVTAGVGVLGFAANLAPGAIGIFAILALITYFGTMFRPTIARFTAPLYAVFQGMALGTLSRYYSYQGDGVVLMAVLGTVGVYFTVLALFRTGKVRVTPRFAAVTMALTVGLLFALLAWWILSRLHFPVLSGLNSHFSTLILFGVAYLVVGVMNLFVDFEFINRTEASGAYGRNAEWFAALNVLVAIIMIYLALLRIFSRD